ncbi:MAG: hypothetical protein DRP50_04910 [Thermotoga sp.]|nr:MAG: hypothetical protein DRP50_04910 [Thermotoga sp.]
MISANSWLNGYIIFNIFTRNFSKFRTGLDLFFGSFDLYQDKRNEHNRGIAKQRYLKIEC